MAAYYNEFDPYVGTWLENLIASEQIAPGVVDTRSIENVSPEDLHDQTQAHFFAGIGGWSYALRLAGWPDDVPVWTGSCPCQPFSKAGRRDGANDARHLWPVWFPLIRECRPPVIFGEQVASKLGRLWLDAVSADLETLGYAVASADLCAAGVGAPHIRQRLFWVAYADKGQFGQIRQRGFEVTRGCETGRVGDTDCRVSGRVPRDAPGEEEAVPGQGPEHGRVRDRVVGPGPVGGMADSAGPGPSQRECQSGDHGEEQSAIERICRRIGRFWSDVEWLPCRDGKARPTQPGIEPLVDGLPAGMGFGRPGEASPYRTIVDPKTGKPIGQEPWRTGMLRGYGNAIVPQVAAAFIVAAVEAIRESEE